jgi:TetR/AcrR family transcriptional regulator
MAKSGNHSDTRGHILQAALKSFADCGYAGTSVQQIVDNARVSKPALYYYFGDKAGLFQALVDQAHDERLQLMQEAASRGSTVAEKLEESLTELFEYAVRNRELVRLGFATAFAAPGENPPKINCREKGRRNFEFLASLISAGQESGELDRRFDSDDLAMGIYGQLNSYVMLRLLAPECFPLKRQTARRIVQLFMQGAASKSHTTNANGVKKIVAPRISRHRRLTAKKE